MPITTILLDVGGVLCDESEHEARHAEVAAEVLRITEAAYYDCVEEAVRCFVPHVYRYVYWRHLGPDQEGFESRYAEHIERFKARRPPLRLMEGIGDELHRLHGRLQIGLAGQYGAEILDTLADAGLVGLLNWRLTQDDFELTKPDPRYLVQIAAACGVEPAACIMVGDRIDKDVVPAHQVGMRTIRIRTGLHVHQRPRLSEEVPDLELPSVKGLAEAALRIAGA